MCGLAGYLSKTQSRYALVGEVLYKMMSALCRRGPDSAGVALYGSTEEDDLKLMIRSQETKGHQEEWQGLARAISKVAPIRSLQTIGEYRRLMIKKPGNLADLEELIANFNSMFELVSMGKSVEIIKQVGSPENLNATYSFRSFEGSHGIGHTRMSTESVVDLSHSQPFWIHGWIDLTTAHNGQITNYSKLRRRYQQRGKRFYTNNDSEVIGMFLSECMSEGMTFQEALIASLRGLDGSFTYLAATADCIAYVRDPFGFKPLHVVDTKDYVAFATEEVALRAWIDSGHPSIEAGSDEVCIWRLSPELSGATKEEDTVPA